MIITRFWNKNDAKKFIVFLEVIISLSLSCVMCALVESVGGDPVTVDPENVTFCDLVVRLDNILPRNPNPQELEGIVGEFMRSSHFNNPSNALDFLTSYVTNHRDVSDQTRQHIQNTIRLHQPQSNNDVGNE